MSKVMHGVHQQSVEQIRRVFDDNLGIIFVILWRTVKNYPLINTKYPSYTICSSATLV